MSRFVCIHFVRMENFSFPKFKQIAVPSHRVLHAKNAPRMILLSIYVFTRACVCAKACMSLCSP